MTLLTPAARAARTHRSRRAGFRVAALLTVLLVAAASLAWSSASARAADSTNVALQGTATAKSTYTLSGSFGAANMIDGSTTTRWGSRYTRVNPADTYDVNGEWAQVALKDPTYILAVTLDWESAYSTNYDLQVSNDGSDWTTLRTVTTPTGQAKNGHLVQRQDVDTSDAWSYVRIVSHGTATAYGISLYEFQVWSQPSVDPPGEARDLARDGTTTAKTQYSADFAPGKATDGDSTTRWGTFYSNTPSTPADADNWIQTELAAPSRVHTVVLNWENAYAKTYKLQVSNDGSAWTDVYEGHATGPGVQTIVVDTPAAWRFVRMQGVEKQSPTYKYGYSLYDFEVWGAAKPPAEEPPTGDVVPQPVSRQDAADAPAFTLGSGARIVAPEAFDTVAQQLAATLRRSTGFPLPVVRDGAAAGDVALVLGDADAGGAEGYQTEQGYRLHSDQSGVTITAAAAAGAWNGTRTLLQLLPAWAVGDDPSLVVDWAVPATEIADFPRLEQRGLMIDPARNFLTVDAVKAMIDQLAMQKMNRLHIHLTDDQGWRIQIDSWPNLTAHGSTGSIAGGQSGYYTKAQYRDIVQYAADRQITVIPEIDVPGHSDAALSSYPVLDCAGRTDIPIRTTGGISTNSLCVGKAEVTQFLTDVIREIAEMTPGEYIHIGADEVEGITTAQYGAFITQVQQIAADNGKKIIGWTPMPQAGTTKDAVHQYWADRKNHLTTSWFQGRPVILSPVNSAYMDYRFPGAAPLGFRETTYTTKNQYDWDPTRVVDATTGKNLNTSFGLTESDVQGVEAAAWGETFLRGGEDLEYMVWPRTMGMADKGWATQLASSSFAAFAQRAGAQGARFQVEGANFWADPDIPWQTEVAGRAVTASALGAADGVVAEIASPKMPKAQLSASITWPDGAVTPGVIAGKDIDTTAKDAAGVFSVSAAHALGADHAGPATVTVTGPGGFTATVPFRVDFAPRAYAAVDGRTVTLTASAEGADVSAIQYSIDGGDWLTYAQPVAVPGTAAAEVGYRAVSSRGVTGAAGTVTVAAAAAGASATLEPLAAEGRTVLVGQSIGSLAARLVDSGAPVVGQDVVFTVEGGSFPGGASATVQTNAAGIAVAPAVATTAVGAVAVTAHFGAASVGLPVVQVVAPAALTADVAATSEVVSGKVTLTVSATNTNPAAADIRIVTKYGSKTFAAVPPGTTVQSAFKTYLAAIPAGAATVTVTQGSDRSDVVAQYAAR